MPPTHPPDARSPPEVASVHPGPTMLVSHSPLKTTVERRQSMASLSQPGVSQFGHHEDKHTTSNESRVSSAAHALSAPHLANVSAGTSGSSAAPTSASGVKGVTGPSVINKQLLSKLNKSLKEKQKTTNARDTQTKNPALIQNVLSTSPQFAAVSNIAGNVSSSNLDHGNVLGVASYDDHAKSETNEGDILSVTSTAHNQSKDGAAKSKAKRKSKKIAKQNSTRTDFFAAKLASAVDDVESSDSDETFVYETNAHEFENESNEASSNPAVSNVSPPIVSQRDQRSVEAVVQSENIDNAPPSMQMVQDNISVSGSLKNAPFETNMNSLAGEQKIEEDKEVASYVPSMIASRAESIHSLQSCKPNLRNSFHATPPTTTGIRSQVPVGLTSHNEYHAFSDPYLEGHTRFLRPTRKSSSHSILSDDKKDHILRSPHSPYGQSKQGPQPGIAEHPQNTNRPYQEGLYAYGEEDGTGDEASSHGDSHLIYTAHNIHEPTVTSGSKGGESLVAGYKPRSNKPSTTSSKLRSTTSKLFDKKGAQPRRYSTIPDDIDIEDFDDELIYYDNNNVRFPYYNHGSLNESSSLLNGHRLPHHRSLNLNFNGRRAAANPRNTRYVSLGYAPPVAYTNGNKKNDIFPFPYPDGQPQSFYGFDEYDEESHLETDKAENRKQVKGRSSFSPPNTRFMLPRKSSHDQPGNEKLKIVRSVIYTLIGVICILSVGFILGFLLASTKDLANVSILGINHATVSQDELVFNVVIEALNPGWFTVSLEELELDIFAKSGYLEQPETSATVETVLLGTVLNFESALRFEGSFINRQVTQQTGEIKLVGPGKNLTGSQVHRLSSSATSILRDGEDPKEPHTPSDNSDKWAIISKHPFDLILRGVIKYNLPWSSNVKSVVVNKMGFIDPSQTF